MSLKLMKKRVAVLLTISIIFGNILPVSAEVTPNQLEQSNEIGQESSGTVTGGAMTIESDEETPQLEQEIEEIGYLESKSLEKDEEYSFLFQPEKSAKYFIHAKDQTEISVKEQLDSETFKDIEIVGLTIVDNQQMCGRGFYLEEGKTYHIAIKSDSNQTIKIIRGYSVFFFDYNEYTTFTEAGGTITAETNLNGYSSLVAEGPEDINEIKFKRLSYQSDNYWYADYYRYYSVYEGDTLQDIITTYEGTCRIQNGYYELEGLYDNKDEVINDSASIESDMLILAKYEKGSETINYDETVQLNKNEARIFEFTPEETAHYHLVFDNAYYSEVSVADGNEEQKYNVSSNYINGSYVRGYYLEEGQVYSIYVKASDAQGLKIKKGQLLSYVDYDMYNEFVKDGGSIELETNDLGYVQMLATAPKTMDISKYKNKIDLKDIGEHYQGYVGNYYVSTGGVVLEGDTLRSSLEDYKSLNGINNEYYELENFYNPDGTILNPDDTTEENKMVLVKYEDKSGTAEEIGVKEEKTLLKNQWYTFSFQPSETAIYSMNINSASVSIVDEAKNPINSGAGNSSYSYFLKGGENYTIFIKPYEDQQFSILKENKLFVMDYDEYFGFKNAGGTIDFSVDDAGEVTIKAEGSNDIDDSNFRYIKKHTDAEGTYWVVSPFTSYDLLSDSQLKKVVRSYKNDYDIVNGYYELIDLYDTAGNIVENSQKINNNTIILAKYVSYVEQSENITLSETKILQEDSTNAFTFTPDKNGMYFVPDEDAIIRIMDADGKKLSDSDYLSTGEKGLSGFFLESGKEYTIYVKTYDEVEFNINRGYKIFYFDFDEYNRFKEQDGNLYIETNQGVSLKAEAGDIEDDFRYLSKFAYGSTNEWYANYFSSEYILEGESIQKSTDDYKQNYNITDSIYELENLYDVSGSLLDTTQIIEDNIIVLGEYKKAAVDAIEIGYKETKTLEKDKWYQFTFKPDQSATYYMIASNSYVQVFDEANENLEDNTDIYIQDEYYIGYDLNAGEEYTIYLKAYDNQNFEISRAYSVNFFDYDEYEAFTASGGTIKINADGAYSYLNVTAPSSVNDSNFRYLSKDVYTDEGVEYFSWYADTYDTSYVLDGEVLQPVIVDYQADHKYAHKYTLKSLIKSDKTAINLNAKVTDNLLILAKYEPEYVYVQGINISGNSSIKVGESSQLSAAIDTKVKYSATNGKLVWSSSNTKVASVDASGKVKGIAQGTANITAASTDGGNAVATFKITVSKAEEIKVEATGLKLNVSKITMKKGTKYNWLMTTVTPSNTTNKTITWTSSNTKVATVNANGAITAKKAGNATITASTSNGKKATVKVTVGTSNIKVTKVSLNLKSKTVTVGEKVKLTAAVTPVNATNSKVTWSSSDTKVAKVSSKGEVTAIGGGKAKITCTAKDGSGKKATFTLTVKKPEKTKITSIKSETKKTAELTWKEVSKASGYEIYAATSKNGTYKKVATVKNGSTVSYTVKKLKSKQKYYFKVKAYVNVSKTKVYSNDSGIKSIKIK
ncbi:Ig-like domain-containing protein [Konateibacter massiliensis]|uniref:Ig-like domain-containing protein n=1 Tax=Konateibacter massiliensis TaxID=2002841 RepID=UPI000C152F71|nr:Ig-like domain-containing protein [Konateibacter massiliensis]